MLIKLLVLIILKLIELHLKPLMIHNSMIVIDDAAVQISNHDLAVYILVLEIDVIHNILVYRCFRLVGDTMHLFLG